MIELRYRTNPKIATHVGDGVIWYRVAKIRKMPYLYRSFSAKEPYN